MNISILDKIKYFLLLTKLLIKSLKLKFINTFISYPSDCEMALKAIEAKTTSMINFALIRSKSVYFRK
jgi:hypothetical protein